MNLTIHKINGRHYQVDFFNSTDDKGRDFGWVGVEDMGGWFFPMPAGLVNHGYGCMSGQTTGQEIEAAVDGMEEDEIDSPSDDLDADAAASAIRAALAKAEVRVYGEA